MPPASSGLLFSTLRVSCRQHGLCQGSFFSVGLRLCSVDSPHLCCTWGAAPLLLLSPCARQSFPCLPAMLPLFPSPSWSLSFLSCLSSSGPPLRALSKMTPPHTLHVALRGLTASAQACLPTARTSASKGKGLAALLSPLVPSP